MVDLCSPATAASVDAVQGPGPIGVNSIDGIFGQQQPLQQPPPPPLPALGSWTFAESVPVNMTVRAGTTGPPMPLTTTTTQAVLGLINGANVTLDMAVMYWSLLPESCGAGAGSCTGAGSCPDCAGFTAAELDSMGASQGRRVYAALVAAAARGVKIRVLQSAGFASEHQHGVPNTESADLAARFPRSVHVATLNMSAWYGDGIQHAKFIIADRASFLLGSSNFCDWRSLTVVKELGLLVHGAPQLASDLGHFFDDGWAMAGLGTPGPAMLRTLHDPASLRAREVPCWSPLLPAAATLPPPCTSPLPGARARVHARDPSMPAGTTPPTNAFFSCAPPALCTSGRTGDEQAMVQTILGAQTRISIAVMDFIPSSMGLWSKGPPVYWPALTDALLRVINARGVTARILVSEWAWSDPRMFPYLRALQATAAACRAAATAAAGDANAVQSRASSCMGTLEVKVYSVPGWNSTLGAGRAWPGHSRVNHNKYIVSDTTANVATSNMAWSYFATTMGTSLNIEDPAVAAALAAIFDRDFASEFARPL